MTVLSQPLDPGCDIERRKSRSRAFNVVDAFEIERRLASAAAIATVPEGHPSHTERGADQAP